LLDYGVKEDFVDPKPHAIFLVPETPAKKLRIERQNLADALFCEAEAAMAVGNYSLAIARFEANVDLWPGNVSALYQLSDLLRENGNRRRAVMYLCRVARLEPTAESYCILADALSECGKIETARRCYYKALVLDPGFRDAHYNLAIDFLRTGMRNEEVYHWREYLKLDRWSEWAKKARAHLIYNSGLKVAKT